MTTEAIEMDEKDAKRIGDKLRKARKQYVMSRGALEKRFEKRHTKLLFKALRAAYSIYSECEKHEAKQAVYDSLSAILRQSKVKLQHNTPAATLIAKYVLDCDAGRAYTYRCVLETALEQKVKVTAFVSWIEKQGGIEKIRLANGDEGTVAQQKNRARALILKQLQHKERAPIAEISMPSNEISQGDTRYCILIASVEGEPDTHVRGFTGVPGQETSKLKIVSVLPASKKLEELVFDRLAGQLLEYGLDKCEADLKAAQQADAATSKLKLAA